MRNILLVEDDLEISDLVSDYLTGEDYKIDITHTAQQALDNFLKNKYDLVLLDLMLPDTSGMEVIKEIRKSSTVPIIIATARDNDTDKALGLNLGADDYVTKPFSLIELSARIRANIRRATSYNNDAGKINNIIKIRDLSIDLEKHEVSLNGRILELTCTEFEILKLLAKNPGRAFSKEQLYGLIWKEPYLGNENVLNSHINRLRSKLKEAASQGDAYIKTLWGIGYKMEEQK